LYNSAQGVGCNFYVAVCICSLSIYQSVNESFHPFTKLSFHWCCIK